MSTLKGRQPPVWLISRTVLVVESDRGGREERAVFVSGMLDRLPAAATATRDWPYTIVSTHTRVTDNWAASLALAAANDASAGRFVSPR